MKDLLKKEFGRINAFELGEGTEISENGDVHISDEELRRSMNAWDRIGLLQGLEPEDRYYVSYNYTVMAHYLLYEDVPLDCCGMPLDCIIFPIIRRITTKDKLVNPKKLLNFITSWIKEHEDVLERWRKTRGIDAEAEMCLVLSDTILKMDRNGETDDVDAEAEC